VREHPEWCECRACLKLDELEQAAALDALGETGFDPSGVERVLSRVDDDPAVEAELSSTPARVGDDTDWYEWARSKLDPFEQAGVDP